MERERKGNSEDKSGQTIKELTLASVALGLILGVIMTAANTYVGLYAGMTVSASIPAAVISMGVLKGLFRRGTIHENNIVQTIASAGESLAAGVIFTIPALLITNVWQDFHFWTVTLIAMAGGTLGVLFMIPLRRTLIVEEKGLIYPEGVACAKVLEVGQTKGAGSGYIFSAMGVGVVFKLLASVMGLIKDTVASARLVGRSVFYFGSDMSILLLGVGYIVGINIAILVFAGGAIGWLIGIPIYVSSHGLSGEGSVVEQITRVWSTQIRYMGVGAMIVGGLWSIIKIRGGIAKGLREAVFGRKIQSGQTLLRTDTDLSQRGVLILSIITIITIFAIYTYLTPSIGVSLIATVSMVLAGFFFVAVSSYIVGLVGSSNNPISGMTICTVLFASAILLLVGIRGETGIVAVLGVAGVVCCAAATAGDISQDLKTGYLVGATPWRQQVAQVLGVLIPAFVIAPVLAILQKAYGIGTERLSAPQATLFANIARAMFTDQPMPWTMVEIGILVGIAIIIIDEILKMKGSKFRTHVMPVAVGIYLPLGLSVPILIGGILNQITRWSTRPRGLEDQAIHGGTLFSSGLIAGEAIMGIIAAFLIVGGVKIPITEINSNFVSLLLFGISALTMVYASLRSARR
ncbi:MAG: OPT family oligopeptide transporter [bacterium]